MVRDPKNWRPAVVENVECEGFYAGMIHYEDYEWVPDLEFHKKLQALKDASAELAQYVGVDHTS